MNEQGIVIYLEVSQKFRDFFITINGSSHVKLTKNSHIYKKLKPLLSIPPKAKVFKNNHSKCLSFELPGDYFYVGNKKNRSECKNYLSESAKNDMISYLRDDMDIVFMNFVAGYVLAKNKKHGSQTEAIEKFCHWHNVDFNKVNFDCLMKRWNRSKLKNDIFFIT